MKTFLIKLGWKLIMCLKNQVDRIFRHPLSRRAVVVGKKMSDGDSKKDEAKKSLLPGENLKTRSIAKDLTVSLVLSIALVSIVFISLNYLNASRRERAWLENKADEYITILTSTIKIPLWDLDRASIENIGISYIKNYLIVKLKIFDASGKVFFEKEQVDDDNLIERAGKVFHDGELLGYVEISLTSRYYKESVWRLLWSSILAILIVLLCLIILTGFLLRMYLKKPIKRLGEIVNSYASGKYDSSGPHMSFLEFQPFVDVLGEMGDKIKSQMTELRNAEKKYRSIFENSVEGIFQTTPEGRFISANPAMARILGYDYIEELIESGNDIANHLYVNPERRKKFIRLMRESKVVSGFEAQLYRKNGGKIWVTINARSGCDENGKLAFFEGFIVDTTERKRAEEALQKAHNELEVKVEERTKNLKDKTEKLKRTNKLFVDRELSMKRLKEDIKELKRKIQEGGG